MKSHLSPSLSPLISYFVSTSPSPPSPPLTHLLLPHLHCHLHRHLRRQPCFSPLHQFCSFPLLRRPYQMVKASSSQLLQFYGSHLYVANIGNRSRETCANFNIY